MSFRTNRRTRTKFPVHRTPTEIFDDLQFKGRYLGQVTWLKDHGFAHFSERITHDNYIWETWMDNFGNIIRIKVSRPSNVRMEDATIVDSEYIPAPERP